MRNLLQRIAYLEGLAEGLGFEENSKEGQILLELIDIVGELAETVEEQFIEVEEYVDAIEEDLSELEEYVYDEDDEDYDDFDDFDFDEFDFYEGYEDLDDDNDESFYMSLDDFEEEDLETEE
ncbi:hypothetical protein LQU94_03350 [Peptoniphilus sp. KCTC 25270]|uniref:CD1247 N-terminal domain-containing protein n=1 Tax=Peptoniphilus sp. KCTC 25270 TaxID=2897414 RepID=UPI001E5422E8|nr:CD1247 N-terminal domain-containing protein [Peptoniphilus sp. KCTC 25270]MCD1147151.1 hypothetical protein [Peptoniphilus sp. KCTC 25270]